MHDEMTPRTHLTRDDVGRAVRLVGVDRKSQIPQDRLEIIFAALARFAAHSHAYWLARRRRCASKLDGFGPHSFTLPPPPGGASAREGHVRVCLSSYATGLLSRSCVQLPQQP